MNKIKNLIENLLHSTAIKNGIWMYLLQFFNAVVPMMTLPYLTRVLGAEVYGVFTIALNLIMYLQVVVEYGFNLSATRKAALRGRDGLDQTFTAVLCARVILLALSGGFIIIYGVLHTDNANAARALGILFLCLIGSCVQVNWIFQGLQEMRYISLVNITARVISTVCVFLFVKTPDDLLLYCLLYSISPLLSGLIGVILACRRYELKLMKISRREIIEELKDGFYVFTTELSAKVFGAIGVTFMGVMVDWSLMDSADVGIFGSIQKLATVLQLAWLPISQVLYPISGRRMKDGFLAGKIFVYRVRRVVLPLFAGAALFIALISKWLVPFLFGAEYGARSYWAPPLLLWLVLAINNGFLGAHILLAGGYDLEYSKCFQIGVAITVLSNLILIYFFHGTGAAIAPVLSEAALGILLYRQVNKISKISAEDV